MGALCFISLPLKSLFHSLCGLKLSYKLWLNHSRLTFPWPNTGFVLSTESISGSVVWQEWCVRSPGLHTPALGAGMLVASRLCQHQVDKGSYPGSTHCFPLTECSRFKDFSELFASTVAFLAALHFCSADATAALLAFGHASLALNYILLSRN